MYIGRHGMRGPARPQGRLSSAAALLGIMIGMAGVSAPAQSDVDGALAGRVTSLTGKPVAGAVVDALDLDAGLEMHVVSGKRGSFLLSPLPVGRYVVTVQYAGVRLTLRESIEVHPGEVTEVDAHLRRPIAAGSAVKPIGDISEADVADLPVDEGAWPALVLTLPGANPAAGVDEDPGDVSFRGLATTQNASRTDGISGDESFSSTPRGAGVANNAASDAAQDDGADPEAGINAGHGGGRRAGASYTFAQAAVREFRVAGQGDAAAYGSALFGHGVGGVITTVSKRGERALHGMGFYTVRDSAWAAANPFSVETTYASGAIVSAIVVPRDLRQQFGGTIGGPIARGASAPRSGGSTGLFYFYALDQQRRTFPAISSPAYAGFYALTPTQNALLTNRGVTPSMTMAALNYLSGLTGEVDRQADQGVNFGRIDWQRRGGSRAVVEYNRARWSLPAGARSGAVVDRGRASLGSSFGKVDSGVLRAVGILGRGVTNELRLEYGRELQYEQAQTPLPQEPAVGPGGLVPEISIGPDGLLFGTPAGLGQRAYPEERRMGAADVLGWVKGRNLLQLGIDFAAVHDFIDSIQNAEGTFRYDSGATGGKAGGLVDWITDYTFNVNAYPNGGCPSIHAAVHDFCFHSFTQSFGQQSVAFDTQEWAGFVQDDWKLGQRVTLHAGLRYEYALLPFPQTPNAALDLVFGGVGATSVFPEDRNNFGPRLGLAIEPFGRGRGTVRVGYGGYFGRLPGATIRAALLGTALPSSTTAVRIVPTTETLCPQVSNQGFGYACSYLAAPAGAVSATTSAVVFDRRFRLPEVQQGTVSLERALPWGITASGAYVLNLDRQLPNSVDINIAPSTVGKTFQLQGGTGAPGVKDGELLTVPLYTARVSASFGPVTDIVSNANATYHGVTLEAKRASSARGLEFRVGWTWSKAIDFGQNSGPAPRTNGQFDPFNIRYDKGLSTLNFPHRVVASAIWAPRLVEMLRLQSPAARTVAEGWSLAGIFSEASGRGYSYDIYGGTLLSGGHESVNGSGGAVYLPTVGRNTLRLPDSANLDLRLSRTVHLTGAWEKVRLLGALEAFNVENRVNYSGVMQRAFLVGTAANGVTPLVFQNAATVASEGLNVRAFGTYTGAGSSQARERQIQASLRLEF